MSSLSLIDDYSSSDDDDELIQINSNNVIDTPKDPFERFNDIMKPLETHNGPFKWIYFKSAGIMPPKLLESVIESHPKKLEQTETTAPLSSEQNTGEITLVKHEIDNNNNNNNNNIPLSEPLTMNDQDETLNPQALLNQDPHLSFDQVNSTITKESPEKLNRSDEIAERKWAPSTWDNDIVPNNVPNSNDDNNSETNTKLDFDDPIVKYEIISVIKNAKQAQHHDKDFASFAKGTGFGAKMLKEWNVTRGLGRDGDGIINPVMPIVRVTGAGLGSIKEDENKKLLAVNKVHEEETRLASILASNDQQKLEKLLKEAGLVNPSSLPDSSEKSELLRKTFDTISTLQDTKGIEKAKKKLTQKQKEQDRYKNDGVVIQDYRTSSDGVTSIGSTNLIGLGIAKLDPNLLTQEQKRHQHYAQLELDAIKSAQLSEERSKLARLAKEEKRQQFISKRNDFFNSQFLPLKHSYYLLTTLIDKDIEKYQYLNALIKKSIHATRTTSSHQSQHNHSSSLPHSSPKSILMADGDDNEQHLNDGHRDHYNNKNNSHDEKTNHNHIPLSLFNPHTRTILQKVQFHINFCIVLLALAKFKVAKSYITRMYTMAHELKLKPLRKYSNILNPQLCQQAPSPNSILTHQPNNSKRKRPHFAHHSLQMDSKSTSLLHNMIPSAEREITYGDYDDEYNLLGRNIDYPGFSDVDESDYDRNQKHNTTNASNHCRFKPNFSPLISNAHSVSLLDNNDHDDDYDNNDNHNDFDKYSTKSSYFDQKIQQSYTSTGLNNGISLSKLTLLEYELYQFNHKKIFSQVVKLIFNSIRELFSLSTKHSMMSIGLLSKLRQLNSDIVPKTLIKSLQLMNSNKNITRDINNFINLFAPPHDANNNNSDKKDTTTTDASTLPSYVKKVVFPSTTTNTTPSQPTNKNATAAPSHNSVISTQLQLPIQLFWSLSFTEIISLFHHSMQQFIDLENVLMPILTQKTDEINLLVQNSTLPQDQHYSPTNSTESNMTNDHQISASLSHNFQQTKKEKTLLFPSLVFSQRLIQDTLSQPLPDTNNHNNQASVDNQSAVIMPHWFIISLISELNDLNNIYSCEHTQETNLLESFYQYSSQLSPSQSQQFSMKKNHIHSHFNIPRTNPNLLNFDNILKKIYTSSPNNDNNHNPKPDASVDYDNTYSSIKKRFEPLLFVQPNPHSIEFVYPMHELIESVQLERGSWNKRANRTKKTKVNIISIDTDSENSHNDSQFSDDDDDDDNDDDDDTSIYYENPYKLGPSLLFNPSHHVKKSMTWLPMDFFNTLIKRTIFPSLHRLIGSSYFSLTSSTGEMASPLIQFISLMQLFNTSLFIAPASLLITIDQNITSNTSSPDTINNRIVPTLILDLYRSILDIVKENTKSTLSHLVFEIQTNPRKNLLDYFPISPSSALPTQNFPIEPIPTTVSNVAIELPPPEPVVVKRQYKFGNQSSRLTSTQQQVKKVTIAAPVNSISDHAPTNAHTLDHTSPTLDKNQSAQKQSIPLGITNMIQLLMELYAVMQFVNESSSILIPVFNKSISNPTPIGSDSHTHSIDLTANETVDLTNEGNPHQPHKIGHDEDNLEVKMEDIINSTIKVEVPFVVVTDDVTLSNLTKKTQKHDNINDVTYYPYQFPPINSLSAILIQRNLQSKHSNQYTSPFKTVNSTFNNNVGAKKSSNNNTYDKLNETLQNPFQIESNSLLMKIQGYIVYYFTKILHIILNCDHFKPELNQNSSFRHPIQYISLLHSYIEPFLPSILDSVNATYLETYPSLIHTLQYFSLPVREHVLIKMVEKLHPNSSLNTNKAVDNNTNQAPQLPLSIKIQEGMFYRTISKLPKSILTFSNLSDNTVNSGQNRSTPVSLLPDFTHNAATSICVHIIPYLQTLFSYIFTHHPKRLISTALSEVIFWSKVIPIDVLCSGIIVPYILAPITLQIFHISTQIVSAISTDTVQSIILDKQKTLLGRQIGVLSTIFKVLIPFLSLQQITNVLMKLFSFVTLLTMLLNHSKVHLTQPMTARHDAIDTLKKEYIPKLNKLINSLPPKLLHPFHLSAPPLPPHSKNTNLDLSATKTQPISFITTDDTNNTNDNTNSNNGSNENPPLSSSLNTCISSSVQSTSSMSTKSATPAKVRIGGSMARLLKKSTKPTPNTTSNNNTTNPKPSLPLHSPADNSRFIQTLSRLESNTPAHTSQATLSDLLVSILRMKETVFEELDHRQYDYYYSIGPDDKNMIVVKVSNHESMIYYASNYSALLKSGSNISPNSLHLHSSISWIPISLECVVAKNEPPTSTRGI